MTREQRLHSTSKIEEKKDEISENTVVLIVQTLKNMMCELVKKYIHNENIERYKDMKITSRTPVYISGSDSEVNYYLYTVQDYETNDIYEKIRSIPATEYAVGDLVRVYISNIEYIGFKL